MEKASRGVDEADDRLPRPRASELATVVAVDRVVVPCKPTVAMLTAGAKSGGVSVERAWQIYQAMLKALG
jgi:hypothetical protein